MGRPRILVFQHIAVEHPGVLREYLREDGIAWDAVELDEGEAIPDLGNYDALWVMGGPMDVWEEDAHPWLATEKAAIREAVVERGLPYLGLCLGHQILAAALGGEVGPAGRPEIGILEVGLTDAGRGNALFAGVSDRFKCLQWHSAEVLREPEGAQVLAASPDCRVQAMACGERAFGIQYHVELTAETVGEWGEVPAYKAALEKNLGPGALEEMKSGAREHLAAFNQDARQLYRNFMVILRGGRD